MSKKKVWSPTERLAYNENKLSNRFTENSFREFMRGSNMEENFDWGVDGKVAWLYDYKEQQMLNIKLL